MNECRAIDTVTTHIGQRTIATIRHSEPDCQSVTIAIISVSAFYPVISTMAIGTREKKRLEERQSNALMKNESKEIEARYNGGQGDIANSTTGKGKSDVTASQNVNKTNAEEKEKSNKTDSAEAKNENKTNSKTAKTENKKRKPQVEEKVTKRKSTRNTKKSGKGEDPCKKQYVKREAKEGVKKGEKEVKKKEIKEEVKKEKVKEEEVKKKEAKKDVMATFKSEADRFRDRYYDTNPIPYPNKRGVKEGAKKREEIKKKGTKEEVKKEEVKEEGVKEEEVEKEEAKKDSNDSRRKRILTFKSEADQLRAQYYNANPIPTHSIGIFYKRGDAVRGPGTPRESPSSCYAKLVGRKRSKHYYTDF